MSKDIEVIEASDKDFYESIWPIFQKVTSTGDTYIYPAETTKEQAHKIWMEDTDPFIIKYEGQIVGTYVIRKNKIGRGSHVCNAGFMVDPAFRGNGIGRKMGLHALKKAKELGYKAMQFNVVVSTNKIAVHLWQAIGFKIIGTIPEGFNHKDKGLVDIYIMHQFLK